MTYPPQPGDYDPYGQQPGHEQQPGYGQQPGYAQQPGYEQAPGYPVQPGYSPHGYDAMPAFGVPFITEPGPRPAVVTIAGMLIVLTVLGNVGLGLVAGFGMIAPEEVTGQKVNTGGAIAMGVVSILVGFAFIMCALGVLRGRPGARTATFILYSISSCCGGVLTFGAIGYSLDPESGAPPESGIMATVVAAAFVAYLLVIILLATPPANRWFRAHSIARRNGLIR